MGLWTRLFGKGETAEQRLARARTHLADDEPELAIRTVMAIDSAEADAIRTAARELVAARDHAAPEPQTRPPGPGDSHEDHEDHEDHDTDDEADAPAGLAPGDVQLAFRADGAQEIRTQGATIVLNEPRSDDDGRPRSRDGLEVAQRLLATLAPRDFALPAYPSIDALRLVHRAKLPQPAMSDPRSTALAELVAAVEARDIERAVAITREEHGAAVLPVVGNLVAAVAPEAVEAAVLSGALPPHVVAYRRLAARDPRACAAALDKLSDDDPGDWLLGEAVLAALDAGTDPAPLVAMCPSEADAGSPEAWHSWLALLVRRAARTDLEQAIELELALPSHWKHDEDASLDVATRLAAADGARAVARARELGPDLDHAGWLLGCVRGSATGAGELVDEWIEALGPGTYDPYGYFRTVLDACLDLGDAARTRRLFERGGPKGWQIAHAARWRLPHSPRRAELLDVLLDRYPPGAVAGRAVERHGFPFAAGKVVIRPGWLDLTDPHPVETLAMVSALGPGAGEH